VYNAINLEMLQAIVAATEHFAATESLRVLLLRALPYRDGFENHMRARETAAGQDHGSDLPRNAGLKSGKGRAP